MENQKPKTDTERQLLAVPSTDLFDDLSETIEVIASKYEQGDGSSCRAARVSDRRRRMGGNRAQAVIEELRRRDENLRSVIQEAIQTEIARQHGAAVSVTDVLSRALNISSNVEDSQEDDSNG